MAHRGFWKLAMLLVVQIFPDLERKKKKLHRPYALPLNDRQQKLLDLYNRMMEYAKEHSDTEN